MYTHVFRETTSQFSILCQLWTRIKVLLTDETDHIYPDQECNCDSLFMTRVRESGVMNHVFGHGFHNGLFHKVTKFKNAWTHCCFLRVIVTGGSTLKSNFFSLKSIDTKAQGVFVPISRFQLDVQRVLRNNRYLCLE